MRIFVFRIAKGKPGGIVEASCPINFEKNKERIKQKVIESEQGKIPYETNGYEDYLHTELWKLNKLRQGWGIPNLDLRKGIDNWIENYLIGLRKYWDTSIDEIYSYNPCKEASGRYEMLHSTIGKATKGDIIIIPTHSENNHHDSKKFTVATVDGEYYYDLNKEYNDFGHVVPIRNLKSLEYSQNLRPKDFTGYYQKALTEIQTYYKIYDAVLSILEKEYFNVS